MAVPMASSATVVTLGGSKEVPNIAYSRGTFVTFPRVSYRVESRFMWQAQNFCVIFRRRVALFVAGAHFGDLQAQHFGHVAMRVFCESHCWGCVKW